MELIARKEYVNWLERYRDNKIIKVVTGLRRVGKSTIFDLYIAHLLKNGVKEDQIVKINFEELENALLRDKISLYKFITDKMVIGKNLYVFLDEVQRVDGFEEVVNSLFVKDNVDVYITGSNAKFLSSEIATLLTGRYVEINVLPLSFREYFEHFKNSSKDKRALFMDYITYGALPGMFMFETGSTEQREYMESVYRTILEKDVLKRNSAASKQLVENLLSYLVYNIGCLTSTKRITDTLNSNGTKVSYNTVDSYFETLQDCYFVYKADRYDVVGKEYLKLINKYYVTDFGFKYYILNNKTVELSQILENLVFLELKRRRFKVATGKVADKEVDFIIKDNHDTIKYVQVAVTVMDDAKLQQELRPFHQINDYYPKYVITLDDIFVKNHDGITTINAIDFLLGQEL
ncbi:MAG: ATP-binding protein [Candidatus Borkfalkiaceae bacterium]|nr:ATP-binding protein [Clostridia bacterium]MDY6222769.1 ATP-binding protein [Christensenellaceae bacterium]